MCDGCWNPGRSGITDPPAVDTLIVDGSFDRSSHPGLDRCHLRWLDVIAGRAVKTAYLYAIVVPELEEAKWRCLSASYRAIPDHLL